MSDIAQALAKAKECTRPSAAPFMTPGPFSGPEERGAASAAVARKARNNRHFWAVLVCVSLPLTAFVLWSRLSEAKASTQGASASPAPAVAPTAPSAPAHAPGPSPALPGTNSVVAQAVAALQISAVMPGNPPRIMVGARVVRAGEVADAGLTFVGIADGHLQFSDAQGVVYPRRY